jgi:hypothetical protein
MNSRHSHPKSNLHHPLGSPTAVVHQPARELGNAALAGTVGFQHAQWSLGIRKPHEWPGAYAAFTLKGLEDRFTSPMLFLFSEDDIQNWADVAAVVRDWQSLWPMFARISLKP